MKNYITKIKKTLNKIALKKQKRAMDTMPLFVSEIYSIIPVLFHYNEQNLASKFDENMPHGICLYNPTLKNIVEANLLSQSNYDQKEIKKHEIEAIYSMGSTGTLGQTVDSDLDIWICVSPDLPDSKRKLLQKKCHAIELWAKQKRVMLTFFIVDTNRFKNKNGHVKFATSDDCGSALNMLLLEEFYLSANLLAGKFLLWYVIPTDFIINDNKFESYEDCKNALIATKVIDLNEWLDFGELKMLTPSEYFGACLWYLYKSIESPFKAVLKALVIEAYAYEFPKIKSLAFVAKSLMKQEFLKFSHLDSYYMMFDKVTKYLISIKDYERLNIVRRCLYLKANVKLTIKQAKKSWKYRFIDELVKKWQWSDEYIKSLDQLESWKVGKIKNINYILSQVMMSCSHNILSFCYNQNIDLAIKQDDISSLMRKIYVSYIILPTKVAIIHSNKYKLSPENELTFDYHMESISKSYINDNKAKRINKWHVYGMIQNDDALSFCELEKSHSIVKLVAWCYFNNLIADTTKIYLQSNDQKQVKLRQLVKDIKSFFAINRLEFNDNNLINQPSIAQLAVIINFENLKEQTQVVEEPIELLDQNDTPDVFNFGTQKKSLITSINLLYRNTWNEIKILNFNKENCLLDSLTTLLNLMHNNNEVIVKPQFKIFCYSDSFKNEILNKVNLILNEAITLKINQKKEKQIMPIRINGEKWNIYSDKFGVSTYKMDGPSLFYNIFINHRMHSPIFNNINNVEQNIPKEIANMAYEGIIQIFVEKKDQAINVYVLNEYNHVAVFHDFYGDVKTFFKVMGNSPIFKSTHRDGINFFGINAPHLYQIMNKKEGEKEIIPMNFNEWYLYK